MWIPIYWHNIDIEIGQGTRATPIRTKQLWLCGVIVRMIDAGRTINVDLDGAIFLVLGGDITIGRAAHGTSDCLESKPGPREGGIGAREKDCRSYDLQPVKGK
jgi:hypothetical protein